MDRFLIPKDGQSTSEKPVRHASGTPPATKALSKIVSLKRGNNSASEANEGASAGGPVRRGKQPTAKRYKPTALEQLRGEDPSGRRSAGLPFALREQLFARPASKKRQLGNSLGNHVERRRQRAVEDENSAPLASPSETERQPASTPRTMTEKIKSKRRLAAAAVAAANQAGWHDIPSAGQDRRSSRASASVQATQSATAKPPAQSQAQSPVRAMPGGNPARNAPEHEREQAVVAVKSRSGRMDEYFPRHVVLPSANPPLLNPARRPSSSHSSEVPSSWGRQHARSHSDDESEGDVEEDHLHWGEEGGEEEKEERGVVQQFGGSSAQRSDSSAHCEPIGSGVGVSNWTVSCSRGLPETATASAEPGVVARSSARTELAERAAAAAERRAAAAAAATTSSGAERGSKVVSVVDAMPSGVLSSVTALPEAARARAEAAAAQGRTAAAGEAFPEAMEVAEAIEAADEIAAGAAAPATTNTTAGATVAQQEEEQEWAERAPAVAQLGVWPCRRRRGAASLFLTQRQQTGGLRSRGVGVGDASRDTFRRQALSTVVSNGLSTQRLRMGCVSNSRTGSGVVRGHPESQGLQGRIAGGVSCLEFDYVGWQLAVGGENVTVYDFDHYLPENQRLKQTLESGVRAYLQPTDGIQTKRTVSCVRWNPANGEQLAVSYLNYDEVEVYDLTRILPGRAATPVLTLLPASGSAAVTAAPAARVGGAFGAIDRGVSGGGAPAGRFGGGSSSSSSVSSSLGGTFRGLGHLTLEFVRRGPPGRPVTHVVAGGRGGVFRVWRFWPEKARRLVPYLQGQVTAPYSGGGASRAGVTAVCCLSPDVILVGTDSGQLVTYSLNIPVVKNFRSSKNADRKKSWSLAAWAGRAPPANFHVQFLRLSPDHGIGVVLCGLRSGRVVIFDTTAGRVLGITEPHRGVSIGYCLAPAAAPIPAAAAAPTATSDFRGEGDSSTESAAPLTEGEGASYPYSGGHWGPVVLACCKSNDQGELVVLSTSARAALDSHQRGGDRGTTRPRRRSGLRPGRGWEIGAAGGGGFRLVESEGYDMCLPVEVLEATPGQREVRLSSDVRGYLCSRTERRLLRTGLVTSSIMIGKEKHSVEAVSADGTVVVLDRKYRGPTVAAAGSPGSGPGDATRAAASRSSLRRDRAVSSSSDGGGGGREVVEFGDGSEVDEPGANGSDDADRGGRTLLRPRSVSEGASLAGAFTADESTDAAVSEPRVRKDWDRLWLPGEIRLFAKLRAVFGDEQPEHQESEELPSYALYQVVARAKLDLPVTAITSHPRMNFVVVGLSDGTVAALLPDVKQGQKRSTRGGVNEGSEWVSL